jgi:hypothetical protein
MLFIHFLEQGSELDDFISGPRELLLKFVEENYPLPGKPEQGNYVVVLSLHLIHYNSHLFSSCFMQERKV